MKILNYIVYYDPWNKVIRYIYADHYRLEHINKYGRLTVSFSRDSLIIKKQNMLFIDSGSLPSHMPTFCDMLTKTYNPNKNNLALYTKENYPELYI